ncbi:MAG: hypothetical protein WDM85_11160 [Caulobacteraceae bacterium]
MSLGDQFGEMLGRRREGDGEGQIKQQLERRRDPTVLVRIAPVHGGKTRFQHAAPHPEKTRP